MANTIVIKVGLDTKQADSSLKAFSSRFKSAIDGNVASVNALKSATSSLTSVLATLGGIAAFKEIAQLGINLDKARNAMTALTGSVDKANQKLAELRKLAATSPGVTQNFATQLFNQLKAIGGIADQTINKVIQSLGKLNNVFSDIGPEFSRNLVQIFTQGFERSDIKEALGRVPIFEQLLKSAFGTNDPDKLRKLKESGKLTLDAFLTGFSEAINNDARFKNIQESLGGRLQKALDETKTKLAELGEKLLLILIPALDKLIPLLNVVLDVLNQLPDGLKAAAIGAIALAPAINTVSGALEGLKVAAVALGGFLTTPAGIAVLALLGVGTAAFALQDLITNQIPSNVSSALNLQNAPKGSIVSGADTSFTFGGKTFSLAAKQTKDKKDKDKNAGGDAAREAANKVKEAAKKRAELIKDLQEQVSKARLEADQTLLDDLANISDTINAANLEGIQREAALKARPAQLAAHSAAIEERIRKDNLEELQLRANTAEKMRKEFEKIEPVLSNSERFMRGFSNAVETAGDAFERFGANVAHAFTNVRDLFNGLKQAVLGFFNDILGSALQNLVRSTLGPIFGGLGGARGAAAGGGALSIFGFGQGFGVPGLGGGGGASSILSGGKFNFGQLGESLLSSAPLLGLSFGGALGGKSLGGNILGAAGGLLTSTFLATTLGAPGALGGLAPALFSNPLTAIAGAGLLVGSVLLGKAKQRKQDEEASGQMLTQALQGIESLAAAVSSGQITTLAEARAVFENQILAQFIQQIRTLKTKSVVESRLKNQVADLRNVFESRIPPLVSEQDAKRQTAASNALAFSRQIPEFATGGTTFGGLALLHPGEKIVNFGQQAKMRAIGGADIFERAGVPGLNHSGHFASGGTVPEGQPIEINIQAQVMIGRDDATRIVVVGASSPQGRAVTVKNINDARRDGQL